MTQKTNYHLMQLLLIIKVFVLGLLFSHLYCIDIKTRVSSENIRLLCLRSFKLDITADVEKLS